MAIKKDQTLDELKREYEAAQSEVSKRQVAYDENRTQDNARYLTFANRNLELRKLAYEDRLSGRNQVTATTTIIQGSETQPVEKEVTPAPEKLNALQYESMVDLIEANPPSEIWQSHIKDIKTRYPTEFESIGPSLTEVMDLDEFDEHTAKVNYFQKSVDVKVDPLSITTGTTVLTASKEVKSFAVTTEASLTNFLSAATKMDSALLDLPGQIKSTASLIAAGAQTFVGQMSNAISEALIGGIKGGLSSIATKIFSSIPGFKQALRVVTRAQTALVSPIAGVFKGMNCLTSKVVSSLQGVVEDMLTAFVKNALNAPACAIQQFIGAVLTKVNSLIDNIVTPLTGGISKVLGPLFKVKDILSSGINLADKIGDFFNCGVESDKKNQSNGSDKIQIDKASSKKPKDTKEQQSILDKATKAANTASEGISNFGKGIQSKAEESINSCQGGLQVERFRTLGTLAEEGKKTLQCDFSTPKLGCFQSIYLDSVREDPNIFVRSE